MVIDTDPENMLEPDQPNRVFYDKVKEDFGIYDLIVVGITDEGGIFRPETLKKLARIADGILGIEEIIAEDVMSFSTTDDVTSAAGFASLMLAPIPPVRMFGGFVAFGILAAWVLTVTLIPASVMLTRANRLLAKVGTRPAKATLLERWQATRTTWTISWTTSTARPTSGCS